MPKGARDERRPAEMIGNAAKVARLATGEETEELALISPGDALGKLGARLGHRT